MKNISFDDFIKVEICVGTILSAEINNNLNNPAIVLTIDFGKKIGIKKSSAQLIANYTCDSLVKKQILAVVNFAPRQVGKIISEVLSRFYNPDYYLVLPWHFKKEILSREKFIRKKGTKFIFPLPNLKIV